MHKYFLLNVKISNDFWILFFNNFDQLKSSYCQGCELELEELGNFGRTRTRKIKISELELELELEKSLWSSFNE